MAKAAQFRRLITLTVVLIGALALLACRLVELQVWRHDELRAASKKNTQHSFLRAPLRGQIRDARGTPLALSVAGKIVCANPMLIRDKQREVARILAPLLQTNEAYLVDRLQPRVRQNGEKPGVDVLSVVLKSKVPLDTWQQIEQAMKQLDFGLEEKKASQRERSFYNALRRRAIFAYDDALRIYPNQSLAAHIIGYVEGDQLQSGKDGIELAFNSKLRGIPGWRRTERDIRQRELVAFRDQDVEPRDGLNVVLTIDSALQNIVETELAEGMNKHSPISISATMVRPRTGEILAMATLPTFDPNHPGGSPLDTLRNRIIADQAEPGSTFKIVVVSAALNENLIRLTDQFDCERGKFFYAGRILHDHGSYGLLDVETIISRSSNIGAAKIGIRLGENSLYQYMRNFGFGSQTGIPLPGEARGTVHPVKNWSKVSIAQIPMGHGVAVTPLQMVMAMSAIANNGKLMRPMLVDRLEDDEGRVVVRYQPQPVRQVISEAAARETISALKAVIAAAGTGNKARLDNYTVAGKTGTAQKIVNGLYSNTRHFSSFIGFFPADNPEVCISVVMDEPKGEDYGSKTAAPVFRNIAERAAHYLNVRPDIEAEAPKQTLAVTIGAEEPAGAKPVGEH